MTRRIEFTVSEEVGKQYDAARGDVPMAKWIKRALESALSNPGRREPISREPKVTQTSGLMSSYEKRLRGIE